MSIKCFVKEDTLCWECQNAVPDKIGKCGCNWSRFLKPVDGWKAKESQRKNQKSIIVISCPEFLPDGVQIW